MIIEPYEQQLPVVQKTRLNVAKLEEATMEAMTPWFNDEDHPENLAKKPFLKEIFKVAKAQERYKNGEIGECTRYHGAVMSLTYAILQTRILEFLSCMETDVDLTFPRTRMKKVSKTRMRNRTRARFPRVFRLRIPWYRKQ